MPIAAHFAAAGNLLRFDRFMELALHDPEHGYYAAKVDAIGARGDFATSATLSNLLAEAIAHWLRNHEATHVIEIGAGGGQLAQAILKRTVPTRLRERLPFRRSSLHYHIVDSSPRLRTAQRRLLGRRATWHQSLPDALDACHGQAFLLSNELVDAFPVRIFERTSPAPDSPTGAPPAESIEARPSEWSELHLTLVSGEIRETLLACGSLPDSSVFGHAWPAGQRVEVHESYHHWLESWLSHWNRGELLTIDYGGPPTEVYCRNPAGTLRAYYQHQRLTGPDLYTLPGHRDLTADVNFEDLMEHGERLGLETISLRSQRAFLLPHFEPACSTEADRYLLDDSGPGSAFKVLRQARRDVS